MNTTGLSRLLICLALLGAIVTPAASACRCGSSRGIPGRFQSVPIRAGRSTAPQSLPPMAIDRDSRNPGAFLSPTFDGPRFRSATFCLEVQTPRIFNPTDRDGGGLIFWRVDNRNYFLALVYPDGSYLLTKLAGGSWNNLSRKEKFAKLNAGPGAVNEGAPTL